jgi:hypothetical protein
MDVTKDQPFAVFLPTFGSVTQRRARRPLYTGRLFMSFARVSLSLIGVVGVIAVTLAAATVWLLVSQPVTTADAAADLMKGNVTPLARALAGVLYDAFQGLLRYL